MSDLKGTLELLAKSYLGQNVKFVFALVTSPFTEPSVEVDVSCFKCKGKAVTYVNIQAGLKF